MARWIAHLRIADNLLGMSSFEAAPLLEGKLVI